MSDTYEKLKKIKKPVLLYVTHINVKNVTREKLRILYPSGKCEYLVIDDENHFNFFKSCFANNYRFPRTLLNTINQMELYDSHGWDTDIEIVEVL